MQLCLLSSVDHPDGGNNSGEEVWMDASEFFRTAAAVHLLAEPASDAAGCGRSSVIRIRQENRGRVFNSVVKFSGPDGGPASVAASSTPIRRAPVLPAAGTRRMSARMGVAANILPPVMPLATAATTR